jgi:hypothetical protein
MAGPAYYSGAMNIAKNADWVVPFLYGTLAADGVTIIPIDLTGSILKMEIKKQEGDNEGTVYVYSPDGGIFINTDPTTGQFWIVIDRDHSIRLGAGGYVADLIRLMPNGYQERLWEGTCTVVEGTTHD